MCDFISGVAQFELRSQNNNQPQCWGESGKQPYRQGKVEAACSRRGAKTTFNCGEIR